MANEDLPPFFRMTLEVYEAVRKKRNKRARILSQPWRIHGVMDGSWERCEACICCSTSW